nr:MAG: ORF1 [Torque teno midi virus]
MPFWWRRRKRYWWGARRPYYKRRYQTKRRRRKRRPLYRNRRRRTTGRRRRRKYKVRKKRQTLPVRQWQPDKIVKLKVKGVSVLVLGADGKQYQCYTNEEKTWTAPRTPGGGGFGVEKYSFQYLYEEQRFGNNIWTRSNIGTDLVRYLGVQFTLYRHPETDFIVKYDRNLPMVINKLTYPNSHPHSLLLGRHKKIIPSRITRPNGRNTIRFKVKPSKVMLSKWFFQETIADTGLVLLTAAACNLNYAHMSSFGQNTIINVFALNLAFYKNGNWGQSLSTRYDPYNTPPETLTFSAQGYSGQQTFNRPKDYAQSIDYTTGWFNTKLLNATSFTTSLALPVLAFSYNAALDDGIGNNVWFKSTFTQDYSKPTKDTDLIISNMPIWKALYGFTDFVKSVKTDPNFLDSYVILIESRYVLPFSSHSTGNYWLPIDATFIKGQNPYNSPLFENQKKKWFPRVKHQTETINAFVKAGPYIPRYDQDKRSTWELHGFYKFFFKLGGTFTEETAVADPKKQGTYDTPTKIKEALQIINPKKQKAAAMLHSWDYRRGQITASAIKRMCFDQETDTDFQTDADQYSPPQKKKKTGKTLPYPPKEKEDLQTCLLSLYEEDTFQETQDPSNLKELIQQQREQQRELKYNILRIISDLKQQQQLMQLQTGIIN